MATNFSGISSGIDTKALVEAILQEERRPVDRLIARQNANNKRTAALQTMRTAMNTLSTSLATLSGTSFSARTVASSDSNNTYVTATANGAAVGNYDVLVNQVATRARVTVPGGASSATASVLKTPEPPPATVNFALQGPDGTVQTISVNGTSANLNGIRDAINSQSSTVTASVVNTGEASNPYKLVLSAKDTGYQTGTGESDRGYIRLAEVGTSEVTNLGVGYASEASVSGLTAGTGVLASDRAKNAIFSVNGVTLTRQSNTVSDAVDGITFTLKSGGQDLVTGTATTLNVTQDKTAATSAMQDVVTKFNSLLKIFKDASGQGGALANDSTARAIMTQVREALTGQPAGIASDAVYKRPSDIGISTTKDGSLSLDVTAFQKALDTNPDAARAVIAPSGTSSNGSLVSYVSSTIKSPGGDIAFSLSDNGSGGFTALFTPSGGSAVTLTGAIGDTIIGPAGTSIEGLTFKVSANSGSGTISVNRGVAYTLQGLVNTLTTTGTGNLANTLSAIDQQNKSLSDQIQVGETRLVRRRSVLTAEFARMESVISQLQAAGSTLGGIR